MAGVVIVGAGQGGFQAAASLRQEGWTGEITLIGAEPGLPYQRPPLSKTYLKAGDAEALNLRPATFFERNAITLLSGVTVEAIDRVARTVRAGGRGFAYDHLILATGTRNLRPPVPGLERGLDLRTLADAERLRAALDRPRRCAVVGGGFIGLEFAAAARTLGHEVTVAEAAPRLMARAVSPEMSARFLAMHVERGVGIHLGATVSAASEEGLRLADGTVIPADLVLVAAGVAPNVELAADAGLAVANGVVVDAGLLTADPAISALGDCACFPDSRDGRLIRLESVQAATDHARLIARRLTGRPGRYDALPWFWSDQGDWKLQIAGLATPADDSLVAPNGSVLRTRAGRVVAVETVNDARTHMKSRRLLAGPEAPDVDTMLAALAGEPVPS
ncbi:MAG: pyridine nucleotide-disulfide oxidoreductase [Rhodovulum sulfidophilum]|uniref:Pyridine nucleotide-disulfide oxidoreductase n=1 Tax=Rhodovulum sulfidophilum TaxID=35806 RepID=A0A2W5MZ21_RHOSU|nr:MAG: pyridine nucleotide-disulfide oxidoreductase [Rhodovulum sulfidophilum]